MDIARWHHHRRQCRTEQPPPRLRSAGGGRNLRLCRQRLRACGSGPAGWPGRSARFRCAAGGAGAGARRVFALCRHAGTVARARHPGCVQGDLPFAADRGAARGRLVVAQGPPQRRCGGLAREHPSRQRLRIRPAIPAAGGRLDPRRERWLCHRRGRSGHHPRGSAQLERGRRGAARTAADRRRLCRSRGFEPPCPRFRPVGGEWRHRLGHARMGRCRQRRLYQGLGPQQPAVRGRRLLPGPSQYRAARRHRSVSRKAVRPGR